MYYLKAYTARGSKTWAYDCIADAYDSAVVAEERGQQTELFDEYGSELSSRDIDNLLTYGESDHD